MLTDPEALELAVRPQPLVPILERAGPLEQGVDLGVAVQARRLSEHALEHAARVEVVSSRTPRSTHERACR